MRYKNTKKTIAKPLMLISLLLASMVSYAKTTLSVNYLVAASDKEGTSARASKEDLNNGIKQLNSAYESMDLEFVISNIQYLTNADVPGINDGDWRYQEEENVRPFFKYGMVNIIVTDLDGVHGHAYKPDEATDTIEVEPEDLNSSVISHEFAHNLGLKHTYSGIDDTPIKTIESVIGWRFGDGVIDTPADPGKSKYFKDCLYVGDVKDEQGTSYKPDGFNIMGKGGFDCRNKFSPQQITRMKRILATDKHHLSNKYGEKTNPTCANSVKVTKYPHIEGFNLQETVSETLWVQDSFDDDFNWQISHTTASKETGAELPVEGYSFAHIDSGAKLLKDSGKVNLLSPCYDLSSLSTAVVEFYYQMYGEDTGTLSLDISTDNGQSWQSIWSQTGQQQTSGKEWKKAEVDLASYANQPVQLRLNGQVSSGYKGDISVDTISVNGEPLVPGLPYAPNTDSLVETKIVESSDDAEEKTSSGSILLKSNDLELVDDSGTANQLVGLRFPYARIPQNAIIKDAYVQFTVDATNTENTNISIKGHLSTDSATFSSAKKDISSRKMTESSVHWSPLPWTKVGAAGLNQKTPDIKSVIQELVKQDDWSTDSPVTLVFSGHGEREAESYDGSSSKAAKLFIVYSLEEKVLGDWDDDNDIDMLDIQAFMEALQNGEQIDSELDINQDGVINLLDPRALMRLCTRANCAI